MPKRALLTASNGPIELVDYPLTTPAPNTVALHDPRTLAIGLEFLKQTSFPFARLMPEPFRIAEINPAYESAAAGSVPRGALIP